MPTTNIGSIDAFDCRDCGILINGAGFTDADGVTTTPDITEIPVFYFLVPEPAPLALITLALGALVILRRRTA